MAEVVIFHHVQGLTPGIKAFADKLREAGHTVHTPDLFNGRVYENLEEGLAFVREIGFDEVVKRAELACSSLPSDLVYAAFSLGVVPAQKLAQTRTGARGALLFHACLPSSEFGSRWPKEVPVQIHAMDADPFFVDEGDIDAAQALIEEAEKGDLFLYSGDQHLFADSSLPAYDEASANLLLYRVLDFLAELDGGERQD